MDPAPRHRAAVGGMWEEIGRLQFDFLVEQGLKPNHYLLDIGCGSLRGGVHFVPYLKRRRYFGVDRGPRLLEAGRKELGRTSKQPTLVQMEDFSFETLRQGFDYLLAQSVFTHLSLNAIRRCLVNAERVMNPGARFYATFFEHTGTARDLTPRRWPGGTETFPDRDPYHYDLSAFEWAVRDLSLELHYIGEWGHPRGQRMLLFVRSTHDAR